MCCRVLSCLALAFAFPVCLTSYENSNVSRTGRSLCQVTSGVAIGPTAPSKLKLHQCIDLSAKGLSSIPEMTRFGMLTRLDLHSNHITVLENVTLPSDLVVLDVSNNNLTHIADLLSDSLKTLNLSQNNISDIKFLNSLVTLERLDLSSNHISNLGTSQFTTLINLVRLDLSVNHLTSLNEKTFSGLHKLQTLDLSHNQLRVVMLGTFRSLDNLLWLDLARNDGLGAFQTELDSSVLLGAGRRLQTVDASHTNLVRVPDTLTRSVRDLYLCCNQIKAVRCGDLDSFPLLRTLDLSSNSISLVEEDALGRSELLCHLLLAENQLESVPHSLPPYLLVLDLDHNFISNITTDDFSGLSKLRTLRLAWNRINVISDEAFGHLSALKNLDLSGNPLKLLSSSTFSGPRWLLNLSLASLTSLQPTNRSLAFPVPESDRLRILNLDHSPVLARQLLDDTAALSMFRQLDVLNMAYTNLTEIRSDLVNFLPRLKVLNLRGIKLNCTDIIWLASWLQKLNTHKTESTDKLQRLDIVLPVDTSSQEDQDNQGEFSIAQNVDQYWLEAYAQKTTERPQCSSPENLAGKSLLDLLSTSPTSVSLLSSPTTLMSRRLSRYEHKPPESEDAFDHDSYQNDFPHIVPNKPHNDDIDDASGARMTTVQPSSSTALNMRVSTHKNDLKPKKSKKKTPKATEFVNNKTSSDVNPANGTIQQPFTFGKKKSASSDAHGGVVTMTKGHKPSRPTRGPIIEEVSVQQIFEDITTHDNDATTENKRLIDDLQQQDPLHSFVWEDVNEDRPEEPEAPQRISVSEDDEEERKLSEKGDEEVVEVRYTHHPGLLVLAAAAGFLGAAVLVMRASQRRQARRGYAQHEDIEVRSLHPDHDRQELW